jgi:hypothetical protein
VKGLEKIILDIANLKGMHNEANKIIEWHLSYLKKFFNFVRGHFQRAFFNQINIY